MDVAKFEEWLTEVATLTLPQRRETWRTQALSEATDGDTIDYGMSSGAKSLTLAERRPMTIYRRPLRLRQNARRSASEQMGWPNLGNGGWTASVSPIASAARSHHGGGRAGYRATAAQPAVARSTR